MRADKFLRHHYKDGSLGRKACREIIAAGRLKCNGVLVQEQTFNIGKFDEVTLDDSVNLQVRRARVVIMLHKPSGYVCATKDDRSPTAMSLLTGLDEELKSTLHIVGRLDKFTTGFLLHLTI